MCPATSRVLSLCLFLMGAISIFLLRALPPPSPYFWSIPFFFVCSGIWIGRSGRQRLSLLLTGGGGFIALPLLWLSLQSARVNDAVADAGVSLRKVQLEVPAPLAAGWLAEPRSLEIYPGLKVSVFASGLQGPRMLAFSPAGDLYVSLPSKGQVVVLPDRNRDGVADRQLVFRGGLDRPHGLSFSGKDLIVAENGRLVRLIDTDADLKADGLEVLTTDLPDGGGHWTRSLVTTDQAWFVAAGSSCNACEERDPRRAAILRVDRNSHIATLYARGLRNSVGLAIHPRTGALWASDNGRDMLGDELPPEELNRIVAGGDYGWPYCYGRRIPDPAFGSVERCQKTIAPQVEMPAHSAPLGIAFGSGLDFPAPLQQMLYVAFHGSWNRSVPTGYKLVGIPFRNGHPTGPQQDILRGWLQGLSAWGRPVAPAVGTDGALYLSDDRAGLIYRITAEKDSQTKK